MAILAASNKKNDLEKQEKIPEITNKIPAPLIDRMKPRTEKRTEDVLPVYMQVILVKFIIIVEQQLQDRNDYQHGKVSTWQQL